MAERRYLILKCLVVLIFVVGCQSEEGVKEGSTGILGPVQSVSHMFSQARQALFGTTGKLFPPKDTTTNGRKTDEPFIMIKLRLPSFSGSSGSSSSSHSTSTTPSQKETYYFEKPATAQQSLPSPDTKPLPSSDYTYQMSGPHPLTYDLPPPLRSPTPQPATPFFAQYSLPSSQFRDESSNFPQSSQSSPSYYYSQSTTPQFQKLPAVIPHKNAHAQSGTNAFRANPFLQNTPNFKIPYPGPFKPSTVETQSPGSLQYFNQNPPATIMHPVQNGGKGPQKMMLAYSGHQQPVPVMYVPIYVPMPVTPPPSLFKPSGSSGSGNHLFKAGNKLVEKMRSYMTGLVPGKYYEGPYKGEYSGSGGSVRNFSKWIMRGWKKQKPKVVIGQTITSNIPFH